MKQSNAQMSSTPSDSSWAKVAQDNPIAAISVAVTAVVGAGLFFRYLFKSKGRTVITQDGIERNATEANASGAKAYGKGSKIVAQANGDILLMQVMLRQEMAVRF